MRAAVAGACLLLSCACQAPPPPPKGFINIGIGPNPGVVKPADPFDQWTVLTSQDRQVEAIIATRAATQYLKALVVAAPYQGNGVGSVYGIVQQQVCDRSASLGFFGTANVAGCYFQAPYPAAEAAIIQASNTGQCFAALVYKNQTTGFGPTNEYCQDDGGAVV